MAVSVIDPVVLVLDFVRYLTLPAVVVLLVAAGLVVRYGYGTIARIVAMLRTIWQAVVAFLNRIKWQYVAGALGFCYLVVAIYAGFAKAAGQVAPGTPLDWIWISQLYGAVILPHAVLLVATFDLPKFDEHGEAYGPIITCFGVLAISVITAFIGLIAVTAYLLNMRSLYVEGLAGLAVAFFLFEVAACWDDLTNRLRAWKVIP